MHTLHRHLTLLNQICLSASHVRWCICTLLKYIWYCNSSLLIFMIYTLFLYVFWYLYSTHIYSPKFYTSIDLWYIPQGLYQNGSKVKLLTYDGILWIFCAWFQICEAFLHFSMTKDMKILTGNISCMLWKLRSPYWKLNHLFHSQRE